MKNMQGPDMPVSLIPLIGQQLETFEAAYDCYNTYARHTGFGIKKSQRNASGRYLRCVKEGKHDPAFNESERQRDKVTKKLDVKR